MGCSGPVRDLIVGTRRTDQQKSQLFAPEERLRRLTLVWSW